MKILLCMLLLVTSFASYACKRISIPNVEGNVFFTKIGLKPKDVILKINGKQVCSLQEFARLLKEGSTGNEVIYTLKRNGKKQTVRYQLI